MPVGLANYIKVEMALSTQPFAATPTWEDITSQVIQLEYAEARAGGPGGPITPGLMRVVVENDDGRWDNGSTYASAPYAGNVVPYKLIRFSVSDDNFATSSVEVCRLFVTEIDNTVDQFTGEATLTAESTFLLLEQASIANWVRPAELTGTRMAALWLEAGVPNGGAQADFVGSADAGTVWLDGATLSGDALSLAHEINRAERGLLSVSSNGQLFFRDRYQWVDLAALRDSQATIDDIEVEGGGLVYTQAAFVTPWSVSGSGATGVVKTYVSGNIPANVPSTVESSKLAGIGALYDGDVEMCVEGLQKQLEQVDARDSWPTGVVLWVASVSDGSVGGGTSTILDEIVNGAVSLMSVVSLVWRPAGWSADHDFLGRVESITHRVDARSGTWYCELGFFPAAVRYRSEEANHYYVLGTTLSSDRRGAL